MRKATWALLIWTVLMGIWFATGVGAVAGGPQDCGVLDRETCEAAYGMGAGLGATFVLFIWFIGFVALGIVWLISKPKENVTIYGPQGQQVTVSEKEARKRVEKQGWSYQPPMRTT
ncbi:MAG TPA: hypothetical protein VFH63_05445 [candidate division Zixibacteria bacterium]|nr:hypothetical protein [candidate division Zixibacteria bacterium]